MPHKALLAATLLALPTLAFAQRGGGGGGGRTEATKHTQMFDKQDMPKGPTLRVRDIEDMSPIKRLIDKRKDLKLTEAQINALKDSETKLKQTNEPLLKAVDSLLHDVKQGAGDGASQDAREKSRDAFQSLMTTVHEIGTNYDAAANEATATFDAEQQTQAKDFLAKLKEESESMLRERMNMGEGRRG